MNIIQQEDHKNLIPVSWDCEFSSSIDHLICYLTEHAATKGATRLLGNCHGKE